MCSLASHFLGGERVLDTVAAYSDYFKRLTGFEPYDYQQAVARALFARKNVLLRAPTGAGKTLAVLVPFLFDRRGLGVSRLIYALPLRTLVHAVFEEARRISEAAGLPVNLVTMQTGEHPDDPFFEYGSIIVTTYDQVLSGLLGYPYGLSPRLRNINAAAIVGAVVVFDEFHLMEPSRAFLTAVSCLKLFDGLCLSVWMTATGTSALETMLRNVLGCEPIPASEAEFSAMLTSLPSVSQVIRHVVREQRPITARRILELHEERSIVVTNTVGRAQALFDSLVKEGASPVLLHSRFFQPDRDTKQKTISSVFGKHPADKGILVATQVVEAGLNLSCEHLHTELCPADSLVQRAGRCARFAGQTGYVHVYPIEDAPGWHRPYNADLMNRTWMQLPERPTTLDPISAAALVQQVHGEADERALRCSWHGRYQECLNRISQSMAGARDMRVSDLIREGSDDIRIIIGWRPPESPAHSDGLTVPRDAVKRLLAEQPSLHGLAWLWESADSEQPWRPPGALSDVDYTYCVCLSPAIASYDIEYGLRLGCRGNIESPARMPRARPGHKPTSAETWTAHARAVSQYALHRLRRDLPAGLPVRGTEERVSLPFEVLEEAVAACAATHDLGKLQLRWQMWASVAQRQRNPARAYRKPLAHTDHDPESDVERVSTQALGIKRPAHACAGAYYSAFVLPAILSQARSTGLLEEVTSACIAAVLSHHGGWLTRESELDVDNPCTDWTDCVASLGASIELNLVTSALRRPCKRAQLDAILSVTMSPDAMSKWWPFVSYLCRTLRLSDQRATAEGGSNE